MTDKQSHISRTSLKPDAKALEAIARFENRQLDSHKNSSIRKKSRMHSLSPEPSSQTEQSPKLRKVMAVIWILWTIFIVYGSLMPFTLREHPLSDALAHFPNFPWYDLGVVSRADWISNGVLYSVYMMLGILSLPKTHLRTTSGMGVLLILGSMIALSIEFVQHWFAPRTVSMNDVVAEHLGLIIGAALTISTRSTIFSLLHRIAHPTAHAARPALILYLAGLCLLALFPFDWFWSIQELKEKQKAFGLVNFIASDHTGTIRQIAQLFAQMLIWIPVGTLKLDTSKQNRKSFAFVFMLPIILQILTIPMFTNQATVSSVLLAWLGIYLGQNLSKYLHSNAKHISFGGFQAISLLLLMTYPGMLFFLRWHNMKYSVTELELQVTGKTFSWLPFYYQYFTTEAEAVSSLLRVLAAFVPLGIFWILRRPTIWSFDDNEKAQSLKIVGLICYTIAVATGIELIGYFVLHLRPDMTNPIIGVAGALLGALSLHWLLQVMIDSARKSESTLNTPDLA